MDYIADKRHAFDDNEPPAKTTKKK
jgi:hypothetical protein